MEHAGIRTYGSKSAWFLIDGVLVRPNVTVKVNITRSRCTHTLVPTSLPLAVPLIFARFFLISCNHALSSSSEIIEINQTLLQPLYHGCSKYMKNSLCLYLLPFVETKTANIIFLSRTQEKYHWIGNSWRILRIISLSLCNHWSESSCPPAPLWKNPPPYPPLCNDERKLFSGTSSRTSGWASTICVS